MKRDRQWRGKARSHLISVASWILPGFVLGGEQSSVPLVATSADRSTTSHHHNILQNLDSSSSSSLWTISNQGHQFLPQQLPIGAPYQSGSSNSDTDSRYVAAAWYDDSSQYGGGGGALHIVGSTTTRIAAKEQQYTATNPSTLSSSSLSSLPLSCFYSVLDLTNITAQLVYEEIFQAPTTSDNPATSAIAKQIESTCYDILLLPTSSTASDKNNHDPKSGLVRVLIAGASASVDVPGRLEHNGNMETSSLQHSGQQSSPLSSTSLPSGILLDFHYNRADPLATQAPPILHPGLLGQGIALNTKATRYPVAMTTSSSKVDSDNFEDVFFVVSLTTNMAGVNQNFPLNPEDPATYFRYGNPSEVRLSAHAILPSLSNVKTLETSLWEESLLPGIVNSGDQIQNIADIVHKGAYILVAGSATGLHRKSGDDAAAATAATKGEGIHGHGDTDGFVTRLSAADGKFDATSANVANGIRSTFIVRSFDGAKDTVHGVCASPLQKSDYIYVTGTTEGYIGDNDYRGNNNDDDGTIVSSKAFLAQIHIPNMTATWIQHVEGVEGAIVQGISCSVTNTGKAVYFGGNVVSKHIPNYETGVTEVYGESDNIFVAKVDTEMGSPTEGQVLFVRQFGSTGIDWMAHKQGLVTRPDDSVVIVGNTKGSMYSNRKTYEQKYNVAAVFAVVMSSDGILTAPIQSENVEADVVTHMPTFTSIEAPLATPLPPETSETMTGPADQVDPFASVQNVDGAATSSVPDALSHVSTAVLTALSMSTLALHF